MRNIVWAYKYWALDDSSVVLDSQKPVGEFVNDLAMLDSDIVAIESSYEGSADFQTFNFTSSSMELPSNYGQLITQGLQSDTHSASFTLSPSISPTQEPNFASVFVDGGHFRLDGLETFLVGAVPKLDAVDDDDIAKVDIQISTSGVYADIRGQRIFNFTSQPRSVRLSYDLRADGTQGETHIHATFPTEDHAEPTPLTQWTIQLLHPERLELSGLTDVRLQWAGRAHFPPPGHRRGFTLW
ncbi:hypothetical protein BJX99DRAFT_265774 [Aspergillus californicus]